MIKAGLITELKAEVLVDVTFQATLNAAIREALKCAQGETAGR